MRWLTIAIVVAGCGSDGTDASTGMTDEQLCDMMCSQLIGCGVEYDSNLCSSACLVQPLFRSCARDVLSDCNDLALCAFRQGSAESCSSVGGVPGGTDSCKQVQACQSYCNVLGQPASCGCGCEAGLSPGRRSTCSSTMSARRRSVEPNACRRPATASTATPASRSTARPKTPSA